MMATPYKVRIRKRRALVEAFRAGGLTRKAFCRQKKIALSTLGWWLRKVREEKAGISFHTPAARRPLFVPMAADLPRTSENRFELDFPDGRRLLLPAGTATDDLIRLIKASAGDS